MKKGGGHGKGSEFERGICRQLSLWWTGGERDDVFWRTAASGARATTRRRKNQGTFGQYGDIQATDPIGQPLLDFCTIELKRGYNTATLQDLIDGFKSKPTWTQWIRQALQESWDADAAHWLIIAKRDRRETIVVMPSDMYQTLRLIGKSSIGDSRQKIWVEYPTADSDISFRIVALPLAEFITHVSRDNIVAALKERVR